MDKSDLDRVGQYFDLRTADISEDYKLHNQRSMQKNTKLYHEAVVSFGREAFEQNNQSSVLESLENFCNNFEQKYNVKVLMTSLHLDEGHITKEADIKHNYHAHILIENYSFETHKTGMRTVDYRTLQTDLANEFQPLGFERGDPERKAQRLEHKQYKEMIEQKNDLEQEIYQKHYEPLENNHEQLKTKIQPLVDRAFEIAKEQNQEIKSYDDVSKILEDQYKQDRKTLKDSGVAKQVDYQNLKKTFEETKDQIKIEISNIKKEQDIIGKKNYKRELQEENPKLSKFITLPDPEQINHFVIKAPLKSEKRISILLDTLQETAYQIQEIQIPKYVEKIVEKSVIKEVEKIIEKEVVHEIPKYVEKIIEVEKRVERPKIIDIDENQRLKEKIKNFESENQTNRANLKALTEENSKIVSKNKDLSIDLNEKIAEIATSKTNVECQEVIINGLRSEKQALEIETKALKTAMEQFLDLRIVKGITDGAKTLLEQFNGFYSRLTDNQDLAIVPLNLEQKQNRLLETLGNQQKTSDYHLVDWENGVVKSFSSWSLAYDAKKKLADGVQLLGSYDIKDFISKAQEKHSVTQVSKTELAQLKNENQTLKTENKELRKQISKSLERSNDMDFSL